MTWNTATITDIVSDPNSGNISVSVTYSDGTNSYSAPIVGVNLSDDAIKQTMARVLNALNMRDQSLAAITLQKGIVDVSAIKIPDPAIIAGQAYQQYLAALANMNTVKASIANGVIAVDDAAFSRAQSDLTTAQTAYASALQSSS